MIAHIFKRRRKRDGHATVSQSYYARYRLDGDFAVTELSLETSDKQVAEKKLADIIREKERERAGLIAPKLQRDSAQKPLSAHLGDFKADLVTLGRCAIYRRMVPGRITRLLNECAWRLPADITPDGFIGWRSKQTDLGPKTLNEYLNAINVLLNWMERQGRIGNNPLLKVVRVDVRGKQQRRRAFTDEEFGKLIAVAGNQRLLYLTAAFTGLRIGELQQVVWGDLKLDHARPHIFARAETTKNRKEALIPLHPQLLKELKEAKPQGAKERDCVFLGCSNADRMIRNDMEKAGIERIDAMGRKLDFHCLRYTFATMLAQHGVSQRMAQELMRHSDPRLTANIYTDVTMLPTFNAVHALPWLGGEGGNQTVPSKKDGTQKGTQNGTQTSDLSGQKLAHPDAVAIQAPSLLKPDFQGDWPVLAATGTDCQMAEREGFEPSVPLRVHMISNHAH